MPAEMSPAPSHPPTRYYGIDYAANCVPNIDVAVLTPQTLLRRLLMLKITASAMRSSRPLLVAE